jgi:hypothetical protein
VALITNGNYQRLEGIVQDGDTIMFKGRPKNLLQRLIMFVTHSTFYHCGTLFWLHIPGLEHPRLMIVEAQGGSRRRIVNLEFYRNANVVILRAKRQWTDMAPEALDGLGIAVYGLVEAVYSGIHDFCLRYFRFKIPRREFHGEICSEFVARLNQLEHTNSVSPGDVYLQMIAAGYEIVVN